MQAFVGALAPCCVGAVSAPPFKACTFVMASTNVLLYVATSTCACGLWQVPPGRSSCYTRLSYRAVSGACLVPQHSRLQGALCSVLCCMGTMGPSLLLSL
jgi:hypothetical protein